jgi:hypothetical protein
MKKILLTCLLLSITVPAFALSPVEAMTCKKVVLKAANNRTVLVRRVTGEVMFAKQYNGDWVPVTPEQKKKYQALYHAQVHPKN